MTACCVTYEQVDIDPLSESWVESEPSPGVVLKMMGSRPNPGRESGRKPRMDSEEGPDARTGSGSGPGVEC